MQNTKVVFALNIRINFSKTGNMKYLGHLDLMRYFQKALRRAHFPLEFSKGFHPHPIMSFAQPLSVGVTSDGEFFDVTLSEDIDVAEGLLSLNSVMQSGIRINSIDALPEKAKNVMSSVREAEYIVSFDAPVAMPDLVEACNNLLKQDQILLTKKTKKSEIVKDIKDFIYELSARDDSSLFMRLDCSSENNVKPGPLAEMVLRLTGTHDEIKLHIHRIRLILEH